MSGIPDESVEELTETVSETTRPPPSASTSSVPQSKQVPGEQTQHMQTLCLLSSTAMGVIG
jgi:hypothetical protein